MMKIYVRACSLFLLILPLLATSSHAMGKKDAKVGVILMPIRTSGGIAPDELAAYEGALIDSLSTQYTVFSGRKVLDKVNEVYRKRSSETRAGKDCDETKCFQDIAIAFQSELIAVTHISKKEDGYFITLKIMNVIEDTAIFAKNVPCKGCDSYKVADVLQTLADGGSAPVSAQPVATQPAPTKQGRFTDMGDGALIDSKTGLMWQKQDDGIERAWATSISYCRDLPLEGHSDWRLPSKDDLESIIDKRFKPTIDPAFTDVKPSTYWSSTSYANYTPASAWRVTFYSGYVASSHKTDNNYVRCVRPGR